MPATRTFACLCVVLATCTVRSDDDDALDEDNRISLIRTRTRWSYRQQAVKQVDVNTDTAGSESNREVFRQVVPLNSNTFIGNVIKSRYANHWVVLFCVPWFPQCTKVDQEFKELSARVQALRNGMFTMLSNEVRFADVDCSTNKPLCNAMDVKTYPVAVHYHGGDQSQWSSGMRVNNSSIPLSKWVEMRLANSSNSSCIAPKSVGALQVVELVAKAGLGSLVLVCLVVFCITGMTGFTKRATDTSKYIVSAPCPLNTTPRFTTRPQAEVTPAIDLDALVQMPLHSKLALAPVSLEL